MSKNGQIPEIETLSEESRHLYDVLNNESDLGCVLIVGSYIDYAVASLLKRHFIESSAVDKLLESPRGSISSFASRCDLAYCLGLISKSFYQNLETLGKIRNTFAHSYLPLALADDNVAALVSLLIPPTIQHTITEGVDEVSHSGPGSMPLAGSSRERFNSIVVLMFNSLLVTGLVTKRREGKSKDGNNQTPLCERLS
jgi:DNA-binding MltR family transcriptional regulator